MGFSFEKKRNHHCSGPTNNGSVVEKKTELLPSFRKYNFCSNQNLPIQPGRIKNLANPKLPLPNGQSIVCGFRGNRGLRAQRDRLVTKNRAPQNTPHEPGLLVEILPIREDGCVDPNPFPKKLREFCAANFGLPHTRRTIFLVVSRNDCQRWNVRATGGPSTDENYSAFETEL